MKFTSVDTNKFQIFESVLVSSVISLWLYWLWTRRHLYRFAFDFPGVFGTPILGTFSRIKQLKNLLPVFTKIFNECKHHTVCIWMGLYPVLLTAEPELIKIVLTSANMLNKADPMYQSVFNLFGGGIIASPVEKWHHNRKLINPSFNHKVLVSFLPIFHKAKNLTITKLDAMVGNGEQKLANMLQRISLGITVETTMGKVLSEGDQVDEDLAVKYSFMMEKTMIQCLLSFINLDRIYLLYKRFYKTRSYLKNFVNELIIQKLKNFNKQKNNVTQISDYSKSAGVVIERTSNIFIDRAIKIYQQKEFDWEDMQSESNTIVAASFETTASGIFSTLVMLAMHPEVQEKLYEEILNVFPEKDFHMDYAHMQQLPYLDMVINETLRLTPAVPLIGRHVAKDTQLSKDIIWPKGLQIMISIFNLHRRTDIWGPNAESFDPDNFLPENISTKHTYAYIPFSKGIRNCIGWRYALFAMKVMIAGLVRNFRFTTTYKYENLKFVDKITLTYLEEPDFEIHRRSD